MKRVSLLLRFVLVVSVVYILSIGLFAEQNNQPNGSTSAAKSTASKSQKAKATTHGTSSGSTKSAHEGPAVVLGKPDPADETKTYPMVPVTAVVPAEFSGDVRYLPQMPVREHPELDLIEPSDYVHNDLPLKAPVALAAAPLGPMPALTANFAGMSYLDTFCTGGQCGNGHPPDTNGDVGLNHYIQSINEGYAIYDKATGNRLAAFTEVSLWASAGATPCTTDPFGDPIVVYDQTADRWILANLGFNLVSGNPVTPFMECLAVSKTGDPVAGGWWLYAFQIDQSPVPTSTLNDYPKFGNWNDGCVYMGANGFQYPAGSFNGGILAGFNKSQLYSGGTVNWTLGFLSGNANFGYEPAMMLGKTTLPSPATHEYFVTESSTSNAFNVRTITSGACNAGGTISAATAVSHATYNGVSSNIVPQPPPATTANTLDSLGNRLMQRVQYRNIGGTESIWVNHTTRVTGSNTSPQWGQIDVSGGTVHTPIVQQQIFRPDTTLFRWMGSLAVDNGGNMALAYSRSNATSPNYPSLIAAGRLATDPINTLPQGETTLVAGQGSGVFSCSGTCHRWGDYSSMSVDPTDDCTFWHTNEYYNSQANGSIGNHQTQIVAFKYPGCTPVLPVVTIAKSHSGNFTQGQTGATYTLTVTNNGPGYTFGTTTVTDALPAGLTATAISGSGWICTLGTLTCTRADSIPATTAYPSITVTANVSLTAPAQVTNSATVSGGGAANPNTSNDVTNITQLLPVFAITKTHSGNFTQGQSGASYTITVTNNGPGVTTGTVSVTDVLPSPYLVATGISGSGWSCNPGTLTCTRTNSILPSASYPSITVTVNVASNAPGQVTNSATVSGGGAANSATANDVTNINAAATVCGTVQLTTTANLLKLNNGSYQATLLVVNNGTGTAQNVKLSAATLGVPSGTPLPQTIGNLVPGGGFAYATVTFPSTAGTSGSSVVEKYTGTYTACPTSGTFGASIRATLP